MLRRLLRWVVFRECLFRHKFCGCKACLERGWLVCVRCRYKNERFHVDRAIDDYERSR